MNRMFVLSGRTAARIGGIAKEESQEVGDIGSHG